MISYYSIFSVLNVILSTKCNIKYHKKARVLLILIKTVKLKSTLGGRDNNSK